MKDDYTTNSHYLIYIHFSCQRLGERTEFFNLGVKGLNGINLKNAAFAVGKIVF